MDDNRRYEAFVRNRITELREQKGVSEHRMSLELGKSGSYIRSITNGISMPSLRELFNIMEYFDLTPTLFFAPWTIRIHFVGSWARSCLPCRMKTWRK